MRKRKLVASFITRDQEFQRLQAEDAERVARAEDFEIEVVYADGTSLTQIKQLFAIINLPAPERPSAILVEPASGDDYGRVARDAVRAGIGWVLLNSWAYYIEELRDGRPNLPISAVMTDQVEVGRIQARQFRQLLPNEGAMLYIKQGPFSTSAAADRYRGMQEGIEDSALRVHTTFSDWTEAGTEEALVGWVQRNATPDFVLDLVGCQNDSQALGARRAFEQTRPDWVNLPLTGCDGLPEGGQRLVREGLLTATVITPSNAGPAIKLVAESLARAEAIPPLQMLAPRSYPDVSTL